MFLKIYLHVSLSLFSQSVGTLVNVVIPRPRPDGEPTPGVGKVCSADLFFLKFSLTFLPPVISFSFIKINENGVCFSFFFG